MSSNIRFSKAARFSSAQKTSGPGPGAYETRGRIGGKSKAYSITGRTKFGGKEAPTPGPGNYNISSSIGKGMKKSISAGNIRGNRRSASNVPGPGTYTAIRLERNTVRSAPSFTMRPRTSYMNLKRSSPGPGSYKINSYIGKGLSKSLSQRTLTTRKAAAVPGPGAYQPVLSGSRSSPSFSLRPRTNMLNSQEVSPGPGAYQLGTYIGRSTAKSMHSRRGQKSLASQTPGPGTYQASPWFGSKGLSTTMKGSRKHASDDATPGPAAYTPSNVANTIKQKAPAYSMRPRTAMKSSSGSVPGPVYNIKGSIGNTGSPSYTMRPRTNHFKGSSKTPGPASYTPGLVKGVKQPSFTMRSRTKNTKSSATPGPKYNPRRMKYGPSFSMAGRNSYF